MRTQIEERALLDQALEAFRRTVGATVKVEKLQNRNLAENVAILRFTVEDKKAEYVAEIKTVATRTTRMQMQILKQRTPRILLVTRYVNPLLAEDLMRDNIEYLDTAGNAFIRHPPLFIYVKGNKAPTTTRDVAATRVFLPKGLIVVFGLLCQKDFITRPYREIAEATGVALGTVAWLMRDLELLGFLIKRKGNVTLIHKDELLERWVAEYNERLRQKLLIGRYRGEQGWWKQEQFPVNKAWWGGEVAAAKLTGYLKPEIATIYTMRENLHQLVIANRLKKDERGNVEILEQFWGANIQGLQHDLVHPILIYADLLATGDQRNIETAKMIHEREITRLIGKE